MVSGILKSLVCCFYFKMFETYFQFPMWTSDNLFVTVSTPRVLEVLLSFLRTQDDVFLSFIISVCCACWQLLFTLCSCVHLGVQLQEVQYHPPNASWPNPEIMKTIPFDYTVHDPKYDDISSVYNPAYKPSAEGGQSFNLQEPIRSNADFN